MATSYLRQCLKKIVLINATIGEDTLNVALLVPLSCQKEMLLTDKLVLHLLSNSYRGVK